MEINKMGDHLWVTSNIYFDEKYCFCGRPYVSLSAHKYGGKHKWDWKAYQIGIAIHDEDDYDIGLIYKTNAEEFNNVLHELINWMIDHEKGVSKHEKLIMNPFEFFPDCGCERVRW